MSLSIRDIRLSELADYVDSDEYKQSAFIPISRLRALSHINNPRADKEDICLFLAYEKDKLIGYLGAVTDNFFRDENPEKLFFLSCMWVLPDYRRDGIALKLLKHAYKVFEGKVLITNFIPQSKKAFEKTEQYQDLIELQGIRGYIRLNLSTLVVKRNKKLTATKPILRFIDFLGNTFVNFRLSMVSRRKYNKCNFREIDQFSPQLKQFLNDKKQDSLFRRGANEFEWMQKYPWVKAVKKYSDESRRYYFSQEGKDFKQWFVQVEKEGEIVGFLILTRYRGDFKTPYLIYNEDVAQEVAGFIVTKAIESKAKTYIGYDQNVNEYLIKSKIFISVRKSIYGFLIGKELQKETLINYKVFDGDGDGGFT